MNFEKEVKNCNNCPFRSMEENMNFCNHPYFDSELFTNAKGDGLFTRGFLHITKDRS